MDLYVLKNLKNQVPFMGRKWRSGKSASVCDMGCLPPTQPIANMKTISAIYAHCLTSLNDDWLSSPEGSADMDESAVSGMASIVQPITHTRDETDEGGQSSHAHSII